MSDTLFPLTFPVTCHTDHVRAGSIFVAIKGTREHGVDYIPLALHKGARHIVVQHDTVLADDLLDTIQKYHATIAYVSDTRKALAQLSAQALAFPAHKLRIIGVTGTKGKTTTVFLLEHILRSAGYRTALLSTVKNKIIDQEFPATLTTQQPDYLHVFFDACVQAHVDYVVMEVAAQALTLSRIEGITFESVLYTNFSLEHSEFYASMDDYFIAKARLLNYCKKAAHVLMNADDQWFTQLLQQNTAYRSFSTQHKNAHFYASDRITTKHGSSFNITTSDGTYPITSPLIGMFNIYNIIGAAGIAHTLGILWPSIASSVARFNSVPGRLQLYPMPNGARCFIDYAHNPSSFEAVLSTVRSLTDRLIVLFGAGGERDPYKRPLMGALAAQYADIVVLTSDNPRSEDPAEITKQIMNGIPPEHHTKLIYELDREVAIKKAYAASNDQTIILLLGKGADEYQMVGKEKQYFSEKHILQTIAADSNSRLS